MALRTLYITVYHHPQYNLAIFYWFIGFMSKTKKYIFNRKGKVFYFWKEFIAFLGIWTLIWIKHWFESESVSDPIRWLHALRKFYFRQPNVYLYAALSWTVDLRVVLWSEPHLKGKSSKSLLTLTYQFCRHIIKTTQGKQLPFI